MRARGKVSLPLAVRQKMAYLHATSEGFRSNPAAHLRKETRREQRILYLDSGIAKYTVFIKPVIRLYTIEVTR